MFLFLIQEFSLLENGELDSRITFVTDNGSNVKAAFAEPLTRLPCSGHNINLVLTHAFKLDNLADYEEDLNELKELLNDAKALVTFAKRSG